jgi:hypothetical protein
MKWYGLYKNSSHIRNFNNKKARTTRLYKISSFKKNPYTGYKLFLHFLYLPSSWNFILFKKNFSNLNYLYIYSLDYFFILPFLNKFLFLKYDYQLNCFLFNFFFKNNFYSIFWNYFKIIFYSFSKIFFRKLKFKGKGYYIYKNTRNTIALQFGYSHLLYLYSFFLNVKFLSKTSILLFGINLTDISTVGHLFYNIKPINIFTGKGIRFSKQIIYKKTGKVSSYR